MIEIHPMDTLHIILAIGFSCCWVWIFMYRTVIKDLLNENHALREALAQSVLNDKKPSPAEETVPLIDQDTNQKERQ